VAAKRGGGEGGEGSQPNQHRKKGCHKKRRKDTGGNFDRRSFQQKATLAKPKKENQMKGMQKVLDGKL